MPNGPPGRLRHLLVQAGFHRVEGSARAIHHGTTDDWTAWGEDPGAFVARFWCEAVGWVD